MTNVMVWRKQAILLAPETVASLISQNFDINLPKPSFI